MNAIDPNLPRPPTDDPGLPPPALSDEVLALLRRLLLAMAGGLAVLLALRYGTGRLPDQPVLAALRQSALLPVALASLQLALTGLAGAWITSYARYRAILTPLPPRRRRLPRLAVPRGDAGLVGRVARWPQAITVTVGSLIAAGLAWLPAGTTPAMRSPELIIGAGALVLAFPLLIAERVMAAQTPARLPEAPPLRALLLLPVLTFAIAGLLQMGAALSIPYADRLAPLLAVPLTAIAAELCLRALGRCFLPPPPAARARAAVDSLLARIIADGVRARSIAAPIREQLGIDFARSWALAYLRAALPAVLVFLALLSWGLSGTVLVGLDQRAVYERFGAPVTVLHPGLHFFLPWPMGQLRHVEYGTIHDTMLMAADAPAIAPTAAEDLPPPEADRLWDQAHSGEISFLIASQHDGQQTFQVVSADLKLRYRVGLTDRDALLATYSATDPAALLRASASRAVGSFLAGRTLDAVLGENREAMADGLRAAVQRNLDGFGSGLDLTAFVIEAIHPPAGAAEAYHFVQAAEIQANARISAERGQAIANAAKARQYATDIETQAQAAAVETVGIATADLTRFTADHAAATASPESFLLERRLSDLAAGLSKSSTTIIDHRIPAADAPMLDLRPLGAMNPLRDVPQAPE